MKALRKSSPKLNQAFHHNYLRCAFLLVTQSSFMGLMNNMEISSVNSLLNIRFYLMKIAAFSLLFVVLFTCNFSLAFDDDDDEEEYVPLIMNPIGREDIEHRLKPLGFGLMGDRIDTDKGAVVFNVTDVSIPGNSNLEVAIRRTTGNTSYTYKQTHYMADWILDVPSVSRLEKAGYNWRNDRCAKWGVSSGTSNGLTKARDASWAGFEEWYDGYKLNIPGQGSKQLISATSYGAPFRQSHSIPEGYFLEKRWPNVMHNVAAGVIESKSVEYVTLDNWLVACGTSAVNDSSTVDSDGAGEGFIVMSPDGTRYTMSRLRYFRASDYVAPSRWTTGFVSRNIASVMATKVEDVHGNWVKYDYSSDGKLERIYSNDNREITIQYHSGSHLISKVIANGRVWSYTYQNHSSSHTDNAIGKRITPKTLVRVDQPDDLSWHYNLGGLTLNEPSIEFQADDDVEIGIIHPSGVEARYIVVDGKEDGIEEFSALNYENPPRVRVDGVYRNLGLREYLKYRRMKTVTEKSLSGPSVPSSKWTYSGPKSMDSGGITATEPNGVTTVYRYWDYQHEGSNAEFIEGLGFLECVDGKSRQLVGRTKYAYANGPIIEELVNEHRQASTYGSTVGFGDHNDSPLCQTYLTKSIVTRGNDTYTTEYTYNTDPESANYSYGNPLTKTVYSNVSTTKRKTVYTYDHNSSAWILGQPTSVTTNDRKMADYEYDWRGRKTSESMFEGVAARIWYDEGNPNPSIYQDPNGRRTRAYNYYRGIPGTIERADGSKDEAEIDDNGWIMGQKDFRGYWTNYERDVMGRITRIIPSKTQKSWLDTTIDYDFGNEITQTITRGDREEVITYDNFQRVILEKLEDLDGGDTIYTRTEYNEAGEEVFKSFPSFDSNEIDGIEKAYDGLGRLLAAQETVVPYARTSYRYLDSHRKNVTDPNGNTTSYYYTGYDGPGKGKLRHITQPLGVTTQFTRNVWDQLTRLRQYGTQNGRYMNQYRYFAYDSQQRLCKKSGRETNSILYQYDAAGNMIAYQERAPYSSSSSCSTLSSSTKVSLGLNDLYQVTRTNFADAATPDIYKSYDANGNVLSVNRGGANWTYTYDELNHLTSEKLSLDGRSFNLAYTYGTAEELTRRTLPSGRSLDYTYDGLSRVTSVKNGTAYYADTMKYHPNNAMRRFRYGNNHWFNQSLTARMLPSYLSVDDNESDYTVDISHRYDSNGNVTRIDDYTGSGRKDITYDALNRVETASGKWGNGSFEYDALGNLRSKSLGSRTVTNNYSSYYNRVTSSADSAGGTRGLLYDSRGNVTKLGDLDFAYDYANQPVQISGSSSGSYKYDGNLKRVKAVIDGKTIYNIFDAAGTLVYVDEVSDGKKTEYIHAAGQTIARISNNDVTYIHSDHLGTPIAGTNSSGRVLWREEYTPFGEKFKSNAANDDLGGYTGHIHDSATGLTYMQARYYDPALGRFLSNDPVGFRASNPVSFNRYAYASNNPLNRADPTGMVDGFFTGDIVDEPGSNGDAGAGGSSGYDAKANVQNNLNGAIANAIPGIDSGGSAVGNTGLALGAAGAALSVAGGTAGITSSGSIRHYPNSWTGNQHMSTYDLGKIGKAMGTVAFGATLVNDIGQFSSGNLSGGRLAFNTGVGILGFTAAWPVSVGIGLTDAVGPEVMGGAMDLIIKGQEAGINGSMNFQNTGFQY